MWIFRHFISTYVADADSLLLVGSFLYLHNCGYAGTEFLYSTLGWTLLSAVVEGASGCKFTEVMKDLFRDLGLENTYFDEDRPIIPYRSRYVSL